VRVLLDACVWGRAREDLIAAGHDAVWAGEWVPDPGDDEILARAHREGRILVTLDKDFGEIVVVRGTPHSGILRLVGFRARQQGPSCLRILESHGEELQGGAIITAEPGRIRVRPP
jgi:predicted nuclease of predicted toxin-antitoxin system